MKILKATEINCGRGLAPDDGMPAHIWLADTPLSGHGYLHNFGVAL